MKFPLTEVESKVMEELAKLYTAEDFEEAIVKIIKGQLKLYKTPDFSVKTIEIIAKKLNMDTKDVENTLKTASLKNLQEFLSVMGNLSIFV